MITYIQIPRRSRKCFSCSSLFLPGAEYASALTEGLKEGEYERIDSCLGCWDSQKLQELRTYWKSKIPLKKMVVEGLEEHYNKVLETLHKEIGNNKLESNQVAFLLALYLVRKRKLMLRQELEREDTIYQIYEVLSTEEIIFVKKQSLSEERLLAIQKELSERFAL